MLLTVYDSVFQPVWLKSALRLIKSFCMLPVKELDMFIWETVIAYPNLSFLEIAKIFVSCWGMVSVLISKAEEKEESTGGRLMLSSRRNSLIPFYRANVQWQFPVSLFLWSISGRQGGRYRLRKAKKAPALRQSLPEAGMCPTHPRDALQRKGW